MNWSNDERLLDIGCGSGDVTRFILINQYINIFEFLSDPGLPGMIYVSGSLKLTESPTFVKLY